MADSQAVPAKRSLLDLVSERPEPAAAAVPPNRLKPPPDLPPSAGGFGKLALLPKRGDDYKAHCLASNDRETTLFCIDAQGYHEGFAWNTYDSIRLEPPEAKSGSGPVLVVRFCGVEAVEVRIEGWNLDQLAVYLGQNRIVWIRELPAGLEPPNDGGAVITRLTFGPALPLSQRRKAVAR